MCYGVLNSNKEECDNSAYDCLNLFNSGLACNCSFRVQMETGDEF